MNYQFPIINSLNGGLAQLARAPALQAGGQRFESVILHYSVQITQTTLNTRNTLRATDRDL